ncbi:GNAT family N-acetyltransferase [Paenibacillus sp. WLX2291]|uniref:GNAT family N-acetyltransferase n=1 Tax=Paenibacillus sp. WLX2291 TaxID=3296934 RepID=UPI00398427B5
MTTNLTDIQIVEYEPRYAASIADMWNASNESWGGDNAIQTEEMIMEEHHNSVHLNVFLAVIGEEVIGYCSFSHYKDDVNALYIALLNVRPDYHGKKVGKRLVLRAIEETITLGWPRIDLYTWPSNVKAVPTYKKAGFFWERRDDATHLINLIPSVLQTPAVQSYFDQLDWYNDSVREIVTEPDGTGANGFDYFTYEWRKDDLHLRMEYERTGRGLRLIETNDYLISATIPKQHRLPFGLSYPIEYEIFNKTGKPLQVELTGTSNEQVDFTLQQSVTVNEKEMVCGSFHLNPIEQEQNPFQTHPIVEAKLLINGLAATFKIGVEPRFPVRLKLQPPHRTLYVGEQMELEVTVENEYDTAETYHIHWPKHPLLAFAEPELSISVPAQSRQAVLVKAHVLGYGIWHQNITIYKTATSINQHSANEQVKSANHTDSHAIPQSTVTSESTNNADSPLYSSSAVALVNVLDQHLSLLLPGAESAFGGETDKEWIVSNGLYHVHLNKESNTIQVYQGSERGTSLLHPQFGLPYSNLFTKNRALRVHFRLEDAMIMEAEYELESQQVHLTTVIKVQRNGIITRHCMIRNLANHERTEPLFIKERVDVSLYNSVIPYNNRYIHTQSGPDASAKEYWPVSQFSENWVFTQKERSAWGISWSQASELTTDYWYFMLEHPLGILQKDEVISTPEMIIAGGTWKEWQDFRAFARGESTVKPLSTQPSLELVWNEGNPFVQGTTAPIKLIEHKNSALDGTIIVNSQHSKLNDTRLSNEQSLTNASSSQSFAIPSEQELRQYEAQVQLNAEASGDIDVLDIHLDTDSYEWRQHRLVIPVAGDPVKLDVLSDEHGEIHRVHNGVLEFQASQNFAAALISLRHQGQEWLDSSYPQPSPKSWWNPWLGGLAMEIETMSQASLLQERREVSFAEIKDTHGNCWSGIAIDIHIETFAKFKGLSLRQYYVTLPGIPVIASVIRVQQQTNTSLAPLNARYWNFYKPGEHVSAGKLSIDNTAQETMVYKAGKIQYDIPAPDGIMRLQSSERKEQLYIISVPDNDNVWGFVDANGILNATDNLLYLQHGQTVLTAPQFHVWTSADLTREALLDLQKIVFVQEDLTL